MADALGQAATHAPQPIHCAASKAKSEFFLGTRTEWASGADPVLTDTYPPDLMIRSNAERSTTKSLTTGNPLDRQGSMVIVSPFLNLRMCSWHRVVPFSGPCAWPLTTAPHIPQIPSRQS